MSKSVYVVIPSFNEGVRLNNVLKKVNNYFPADRIIIVDDGSKNPVKVKKTQAIILQHQINLGKGAALQTGVEYAFKKGAKAIILMDADGQHDPKELPQFIQYLNKGNDIVFGSRRPTLQTPLVRLLGNKFASIYINVLFGVYISDILSGFRAFNKKAYKLINWSSSGYGVETEMVALLGKHREKLKYVEFPIETIYLDKYKGVTIIDAVKILFNTVWWKLF